MSEFHLNSSGIWVPPSAMGSQSATVYVDESGNSGPNYIDLQQPFYVLAGWLVPDDSAGDAAAITVEFLQNRFPKREELKAEAVLRNDRTRRWCGEFFRALGRAHCIPLYLVAEKRFCVAGKIVETFMDPLYNSILKMPFTGDTITKQEIANTLYDQLPDVVLHEFANAYRAPDASTLASAFRSVVSSVGAAISPELAKAVAGSEPFIEEIAAVEAATSPLGDVAGTLNMPCLIGFLMLVENLARIGVHQPIRVLHDEQHQYGEGYKRIFEMHRGVVDWFCRMPHTDATYTNLKHVAAFEVRGSKESPLIQAADLLAGVVHYFFKIAGGTEPIRESDLELARTVLPGLVVPEPRFTWLTCSTICTDAVVERLLVPLLQTQKPEATASGVHQEIEAALAPMFPVQADPSAEALKATRQKFDLPLFGLVGEHRGGLMFVQNDEAEEPLLKRIVVLFSSAERAEMFLSQWEPDELNQPQRVESFGPKELPRLVELLKEASEYASVLTLDPGEPPLRLTLLAECIESMENILYRIKRVFASGLDAVLIEHHEFSGQKVLSIQSHGGTYAAMVFPFGTIYTGATRSAALEALRKAEKL